MKLPNGDEFWSYLKVDIETIRQVLAEQEEDAFSSLDQSLSSNEIPLVSDGIISDPPDIPWGAYREIKKKNPNTLLTLLALRDFMSRKSDSVIQWKANSVLGKETIDIKESDNNLVLLFHILKKDKNHLMDIMIKNLIERKSFKELEILDAPKENLNYQVLDLSKEEIDIFLEDADKVIADNENSYCWHIIKGQNWIEAYFRRGHKKWTEKPTENINERVGKSTIIRIHKDGLKSELWTKQRSIAMTILNSIGGRLFGEKIQYTRIKEYNTIDPLEKFLIDIGRGLDDNIHLKSLHRMNSPITNNPSLAIEVMNGSLKDTLEDLEVMGIDLLFDIGKTVKEFAFSYKENGFTVSVVRRKSGVILYFKNMRGPNEQARPAIEYIREKYHLELTLGGK